VRIVTIVGSIVTIGGGIVTIGGGIVIVVEGGGFGGVEMLKSKLALIIKAL
jgi:hypothetical protein